jgi:hypothetical protein
MDTEERGADFSQPTSPESTVFSSPLMQARNLKGIDMPFRPFGLWDIWLSCDIISVQEVLAAVDIIFKCG